MITPDDLLQLLAAYDAADDVPTRLDRAIDLANAVADYLVEIGAGVTGNAATA